MKQEKLELLLMVLLFLGVLIVLTTMLFQINKSMEMKTIVKCISQAKEPSGMELCIYLMKSFDYDNKESYGNELYNAYNNMEEVLK